MNYYFNHTRLDPCLSINDIGVDIDSLLHLDKHIERIVATAYSLTGSLFRGFVSRNVNVFRQAYITYIRPLSEYASNVWSPRLIMQITSLERVQRHFTKIIIEPHDLFYQERLTVLNLETLEHRRLSSDLTMYYKVFHSLTPWAPNDYFNVFIAPHDLHPDFNIRKPFRRTNIFANDF